MAKVKYISSPNEIPAGKKYVLVMYGEEYAQTTHPLGLTITVARTVSQLSFLTAVHTAKGIRTRLCTIRRNITTWCRSAAFSASSRLDLNGETKNVKDKASQRDHCAPTLGDSLLQSIRIGFSVHTGQPSSPELNSYW